MAREPEYHEQLVELAETQHGVVGRHQWEQLGVRPAERRRLIAGQEWEQLTPHVLRRRGAPITTGLRVSAAVLDVGPRGLLSHGPACAWWGHMGSAYFPVHCCTTARSRRKCELAVVHRVRWLPEEWVRVLYGVPVVGPEFVALHLFATQHPARASRLADAMWSQGVLSGRTVGEFLVDAAASGRNGVVGLRQWYAERGDDYVPPDSGRESRLADLAERARVPLERQMNSGNDREWLGRVDFRHPTLPLIVEVQSEFRHSSLTEREDDRRRIDAFEAAGFVVVEIHDDQLFRDGPAVQKLLRDGLRRAALAST